MFLGCLLHATCNLGDFFRGGVFCSYSFIWEADLLRLVRPMVGLRDRGEHTREI